MMLSIQVAISVGGGLFQATGARKDSWESLAYVVVEAFSLFNKF